MEESACVWCGALFEAGGCFCPECDEAFESDRGLPIGRGDGLSPHLDDHDHG